MSILTNEKYKGAALLQKKFTVDFLTKKQKVNEGEVPQYYVENSHEPIIDPVEFDMVQDEIRRRREGGPYNCVSVLSSRVVCGDCGVFTEGRCGIQAASMKPLYGTATINLPKENIAQRRP